MQLAQPMAIATDISNQTKMHSSDRILVLRPIEGKTPVSVSGLLDSRLFTGENKLHALMDTQTSLWSLKYEQGGLPEPLKQRFTSIKKLMDFVTAYFNKRNVEIAEIKDNHA